MPSFFLICNMAFCFPEKPFASTCIVKGIASETPPDNRLGEAVRNKGSTTVRLPAKVANGSPLASAVPYKEIV